MTTTTREMITSLIMPVT